MVFEIVCILNVFCEKLVGVGNIMFNLGLIVGGIEVSIDVEIFIL